MTADYVNLADVKRLILIRRVATVSAHIVYQSCVFIWLYGLLWTQTKFKRKEQCWCAALVRLLPAR